MLEKIWKNNQKIQEYHVAKVEAILEDVMMIAGGPP